MAIIADSFCLCLMAQCSFTQRAGEEEEAKEKEESLYVLIKGKFFFQWVKN